MKVLGIETSCDETAIAVLEISKGKFRVLSNVISSQIKIHAKYGGVVPHLAAREHEKNLPIVLKRSLRKASTEMKDIDLITVTRGPGLAPALWRGINFAKDLADKNDKALIGVNHLEGHIYSNWLKNRIKNPFPAINLIVSGGHTELVLMKDYGKYKIIGETLDDAIGEAFDKVARLLDLGYPGGPIISKISEKGNIYHYPLPSPMIHSKDYNFSYSGLKTAVLYLTRDLKIKKLNLKLKSDIAASFQKAAVDVLLDKTIKAAKEYKVRSIMLSGGVSANKYLRNMLKKEVEKLKIYYYQPKMEYTTDNAAMIAMAGYFNYKKDRRYGRRLVKIDANLGF